MLKRRHHYIPEKYQEGFCRNDSSRPLLWWFNRERNTYRCEQPKNIAVQKDFYSVRNPDGTLDDSCENALSVVEGQAWPIIAKIQDREPLSADDRLALSAFLSLLLSRTPEFDETVRAIGRRTTEAMIEKGWIAEAPPDLFGSSREDVIETMIESSLKLIPVIAAFDWIVLHAPSDSAFIVTDDPFIIVPPPNIDTRYRGVGIATAGSKKFVPLTSNTCLLMTDRGGRYSQRDLGAGKVRQINFQLAIRAFQNVFARDEALLRKNVERARLKGTSPGPRIVVG
ncbi:MAG: DUF4238 domain-containing protein [Limisphaerales bacterium]